MGSLPPLGVGSPGALAPALRDNGAVREATTIIAEGVRFIGDVAGDGNVEVHGRLQGAVHIGGELYVGPTGLAKADVVAARVRVDGHLEGRIRATQQIAIGSDGVLEGEVQGLLAVAEGGIFRGRVELEPPDLASTTMEAPPIVESKPGHRLHRLERTPEPPRLRLPERRRSATSPSVDRESVITRKMPQVRGDASHPLLATSPQAEPSPETDPSITSGRRPAPRSRAQVAPRHIAPQQPAAGPDAPRRPARLQRPAPKPAGPGEAGQPFRPDRSDRASGVRRAVTPPHPPRRHSAAQRDPRSSGRIGPGDPVHDREDLSDEWFEEEDYLLQDR